MHRQLLTALLAAGSLLAPHRDAHAIRPFVTDDARVVGDRLAQIETWLQSNSHEIAHNVLGAIGPTDWLEDTLGFTHGGINKGPDAGYSITGPIFQLKALAFEPQPHSWPGLAFAAGVLPPFGHGGFTPRGPNVFAFMALTESLFDEDLLLHVNLGVASADEGTRWKTTPTTGFGFQARVIAGLHAVAEIYYADPYDPLGAATASQVGFRYIVSDDVQFDGTIGSTLTGNSDRWWTFGVRLVSNPLW